MKIAATIVRILLGLAFIFFGVMAYLLAFHVMPSPEMPAGLASDFNRALFESHYFLGIAAVEIIGGILLLISGRIAPLGLLMIGPVIVNIAFYHIFLQPQGAA